MKKIAITQRLVANDSYYEVREALDINWGKVFRKLDYLPIVLPIEIDCKHYFNSMHIDGIVLTGGNDLSVVNSNDLSVKRDNYEKMLIEYAIENKIPLFGVCRGMQIIADYFKLPLIEVQGHVAIKHKLLPNKETKYYDCLLQMNEVNSFHNFAVENVSNDFFVAAKSEDGIIKAIEHKDLKIFAQMWHLEREEPLDDTQLKLVKDFFND